MWHSGYRHLPGVLVENQMAYAGSPEPIRLEDAGTHGVVYGEITEDEQAHIIRRLHWFPVRAVLIFLFPAGSIPARHRPVWNRKYRMRFSRREAERYLLAQIQGYRNPELEFQLEALKAYGNIVRITDETRPLLRSEPSETGKLGTPVGAYIHWFEKNREKWSRKHWIMDCRHCSPKLGIPIRSLQKE